MKRMMSRAGIAAVVALFALGGAVSHGAVKPERLTVKPGTLSGVVTDATGKILANISLQIKQEGKVVSEAKSDENGRYVLKGVPVGKLDLLVGGHVPMHLMAAANAEVTQLQIVVPQREPYSAGEFPVLTTTQWIWVGVGTGAAAAVATPVIMNNTQGGSSKGNVSP
jgi:ABC-type nitrate/sulfonate/bicarbonate transport system substrate-binding protein